MAKSSKTTPPKAKDRPSLGAGGPRATLTLRQRRFVDEYLIDSNAARAATRAGYSAKVAATNGPRLLKYAHVAVAVAEGQAARSTRTSIDADWVLIRLARLADYDARKFFGANGAPIPLADLDDDTAYAVVGLETRVIIEDNARVGDLHKLKLADKQSALESIGKHLGMFVDRAEISGPRGGSIPIEFEQAVATAYPGSEVPA